jgi:hypothetical protein
MWHNDGELVHKQTSSLFPGHRSQQIEDGAGGGARRCRVGLGLSMGQWVIRAMTIDWG